MTHQADKKTSLGVIAILALAVLAILFTFVLSGGKRERTASKDELAFIAPIAPGALLEQYKIEEVHPVENGVLRVVCAKDKARVQLDVALQGENVRPASYTGRYAIFYSLENAPESDGQLLAKALAGHVHSEMPPPPGMTVFVPHNPDLAH